MRLKVTRTTKNKVITLELSTMCFTELENEMLEQLGEPIISIDRSYGQNPIKFAKKIKSNFIRALSKRSQKRRKITCSISKMISKMKKFTFLC